MKALLLLLVIAACSDSKKVEPKREPERQRRVDTPSRGVRAYPPHAIRSDGVGPYKLGATITQLLDQLPSGPRITQFTLPGVIQRDILRAEKDDAILIGTEPQGKATFVSVVRSEIARTEAGIHVGSSRAELEHALGAPVVDTDRAQDPHIFIPANLKNARILLEGDRIVAFVIATEPDRTKDAGTESVCTRPQGDREKQTFGICLSSSGELVRYSDNELALLARDTEKPITTLPVRGLVFAAPLRNPTDGRDDLVAVVKNDDGQTLTWAVVGYRLHEGKLTPQFGQKAYELTAANARWIGAELRDLQLYLELSSRADSIEVGGLLTTREGDTLRDVVVISPSPVPRRPRVKAVPHEPSDAGTPEAPATERAAH